MSRDDSNLMGGLSRRDMVKGTAAGAAAIAGGLMFPGERRPASAQTGQGGSVAAATAGLDLALVNGKFVDGRGVVATAITIKNGRITNVGQAQALGPDARVINLRGRTVIPGLFDSHVHYTRAGVNPGYEARSIERAFSIAELQQAIARRSQSVPLGEFITCVGGWNHLQLAENRRPTKAELNTAAPHHAVYIAGQGGGTGAIANSLGQTFFTGAGVAVDDDTGIVSSPAAALAALQAVQTDADKLRGTAELNAHANSLGLTGVINAGNNPDLEFPLRLWREGKLTVRMRPKFPSGSVAATEARILNNFSHGGKPVGDDLFRVPAFGERIGLTEPINDEFEPTLRLLAEHRWTMQQHSLNNAELNFHIPALEAVALEYPLEDLRWSLIHVPTIDGNGLQRLINIGVNVLPHGSSRYLGLNAGPPFRTIQDSGIPWGAGTDATNVAPLDPWLTLFHMTTGRNLAGNLINDGQQVSRLEALRAYTLGTAHFAWDDNDLGSFDVGKYADLAVLSEDYLTVPEDRIRRIESLLTLVGGRIVHAAGPFANLMT